MDLSASILNTHIYTCSCHMTKNLPPTWMQQVIWNGFRKWQLRATSLETATADCSNPLTDSAAPHNEHFHISFLCGNLFICFIYNMWNKYVGDLAGCKSHHPLYQASHALNPCSSPRTLVKKQYCFFSQSQLSSLYY